MAKKSKPKEQYIQECREWIARRRAWIDQQQKFFDDRYPFLSAKTNKKRLDDLEAWKFEIEVHEWELQNIIDSPDEEW